MKITPIPGGTKDILPSEASELRFLEDSIREVFLSFGYGEVITPTLELESTLELAGEDRFRRSFRLFDEQGHVMVMRPEMTTPIARLVANRMTDRNPPFRLCYFTNSFRPTKPQRGRQSEFLQAGVELIGFDSAGMDAEVLAIACRALAACGLSDFSIILGEVSFFRALLDSLEIRGESRSAIFAALASRDMVELGSVVDSLGLGDADRRSLMSVVNMRGGPEVLTTAKDLVCGDEMDEALKRLARTYYMLSRQGQAARVLIDLGLLRNFEYYTGVVFELLSGSIGFPLGGGGRYDGLLGRFGMPMPAVGFAVGLDRLHIAVTEQAGRVRGKSPALVLVGGLDSDLELATNLREQGIAVIGLSGDTLEAAALKHAAESGAAFVALRAPAIEGRQDSAFTLFETTSSESVTISGEDMVARLKAADVMES